MNVNHICIHSLIRFTFYFYSSGFERILAFLTLCYITVGNESKKCLYIIHEVSIPLKFRTMS